ncbi:hypothetical protein [Paludibacterium yongneupense]|uniref:hypothetical protein n=1 Tax=Paludibacterium yongneupense TaxID=400061 RepID=UPI000428EE6A|nr:hypothetical protein [Paludibacterium yongneupense]
MPLSVRWSALLLLFLVAQSGAAVAPDARVAHAPVTTFTYTDAATLLRLAVPTGWRVQAETLNGTRQLRVVPPKADQRERAAIDVTITVRRLARRESLERMARRMRTPDDDREAALLLKLNEKAGRLTVEYREGHYVSSSLWIVRQTLLVVQQTDKSHVVEARCAANASEYRTYRRFLETLCNSIGKARHS